ncbi:hypothetical protein [Planococcus lenghuensis]|uniref:Uncharacterized protein n=1 Tax=Planococcus lenghuensis TaxID=2213202 RepID=A0A1Q2KVU9_9BACL|nr:hypothetical protein [Planococcus lenghuensis]AQQ52319.1 hypothetical protein B0X71_03810 [Planococcus lenghuensis]
MNRWKAAKLVPAVSLALLAAGCAEDPEIPDTEEPAERTVETDLAQSSITYDGEEYVFDRIVPVEDIDQEQLVETGEVTDEEDNTLIGAEILSYEADGSLFIVDDTGPVDEWLKYTAE